MVSCCQNRKNCAKGIKMTPSPLEEGSTPHFTDDPVSGDQIVISGMAGLYPESRYVPDLEKILYSKMNPISDKVRWQYNHPEVVHYSGIIPGADSFDAQFFRVHYRFAATMDPMSRKLLEAVYEALYDAGVSPEHLHGKKVGVYIGTCYSETEKTVFYTTLSSGLGIAGCSKTMYANRISYWLNLKGPSVSIDQACTSSTAALEQACKAITEGVCESAIVGGANLCLHPQSSIHYGRIMNMTKNGKTKSFAEDASGCVRSEAINVIFIQKARDAKRIYAGIMHVKSEFVSLLNGIIAPKYGFYRNPSDTAKFLKKFYEEAGVAPALVEYVEAMGSATPEADKSELEAYDEVFCNDRDGPLLVGSVMSNIGYGEAASGISAVTKVLLGYHKGEIAGNLHCDTPRRDVEGLQEGRIRIVTDNQPFRRTYTAVNNMSVTGVNAHVLLYGFYKPKDLNRYRSNIPRLVTVSGRQESSVQRVFDCLKSEPIDPEQLALLYNIHETDIPGHLSRGFIILDTDEEKKTVCLSERIDYFNQMARPLWFVYSGMGSQWAGMGTQLMRIPIFAAAIERCRKVLEPKGIDIVHIITTSDVSIFDNILHSFVGIAAVQIGLTDILRELGIVPEYIIGHSVGELGCAYADGCLTAEEMILSAYSRGLVSLETPFIRGSMAAVGMGYQQMSKMCPPEIDVACHNSAKSCTISGPAEVMREFVAELTSKQIFAKEVPCSNIAYHSRYIASAGPGLLKYLKEVIKTPRVRSKRWISTSIPQDLMDGTDAEESVPSYCSAEYHTNNLLNPVLFEEASRQIPTNAVLVEVAPHGLLQAILTRALPDAAHVPLTRRGHSDNVLMLLEAVGKIYSEGYYPKVQVLYPKVEFPVSTGTPYLSNFVDWAHEEKWPMSLYQSAKTVKAATRHLLMTIYDDDYSYLTGHVIRNKIIVPFSFALVAAWDTLTMTLNLEKKSASVKFHQVQFFTQPIINDQTKLNLRVSLHRGNGYFEIMNEDSKVATGFISVVDSETKYIMSTVESETENAYEICNADVYRLLYERDYAYRGAFRSIHSVNNSISNAKVLWNDNWVAFIDGLFQLNVLKHTYHGVSLPEKIGEMIIDLEKHNKSLEENRNQNDNSVLLEAQLLDVHDRTRCGGILMQNMRFHTLLHNEDPDRITLDTPKFVSRFDFQANVSIALKVLLQIVAENINKDVLNVVGLEDGNSQMFEEMENIVRNDLFCWAKIQYQLMHKDVALEGDGNFVQNVDLILVQNLSKNINAHDTLRGFIKNQIFIINEDNLSTTDIGSCESLMHNTVSIIKSTETQLELACWKPEPVLAAPAMALTVNSESDIHMLIQARNEMPPQNGLIVLTSYPPVDKVCNLVRKWRSDTTRNQISLYMINKNGKDMNDAILDDIPKHNLAFNIFNKESWGGEYYLPLEENTFTDGRTILQSSLIGDLDSLHWVKASEVSGTGILVKVHYTGIHMDDMKRALGEIPFDTNAYNQYGMEFSGKTDRGEKVMGLVLNGAASNEVMAQPEMLWPVPSYWSLEDAATVPFAYVYAYYCLSIRANKLTVSKKVTQYTVLVHGGAGALGQATISVALARGYRVFTTVADASKKRFLLRLFPELNEDYIGNSRDSSFGDMILCATYGNGCDIVVCCVHGHLKNTSFDCCGPLGTMFDTVQIINGEDYMFGMNFLTHERSYVVVDIMKVLNNIKYEEFKMLHKLISNGITRGHVRPLSRIVFPPQEAARAFRLLAGSHHRGRVLLNLQDSLPQPQPRLLFEADRCHIIICDLQPLGLQLAEMLINHGVNKLHLHFETVPSLLQYKQRMWQERNVQVTVSCENLHDINNVMKVMTTAALLGSIGGLYCDMTAKRKQSKTVVKNLNLACKKYCSSIKNLLIISSGIQQPQNLIPSTNEESPLTILDISLIKKFQDTDGVTWYSSGVEAAILALQCIKPVPNTVFAHSHCPPRVSLVKKIAVLAGLDISKFNETLTDTSLKQIKKSKAVAAFLRNVYNIYLEEEALSSFTLERLMQIEDKTIEKSIKDTKGLAKFYTFVDPDELMATTEIVPLQTLSNSSVERDTELDLNETYLFIVPGLEGHHARFQLLCERLKLPALVLQPGLDRPDETPIDLATRYFKVIMQKIGLKETFYILGYETGVTVALELAVILEEHGFTGKVFCVGDGPKEVASILEEELSSFNSDEAIQAGVVRHIFELLAPGSAALAERALLACGSWPERVDACVRSLLGHMSYSAQYVRAVLEAAYARLCMYRRYSTEPRVLRSQIVLLRASDVSLRGNENSLQRYSSHPLVVHELSTPLAHAAIDLQVPAIVNRHLDNKILQAFEKKNLCESYLMNSDLFVAMSF